MKRYNLPQPIIDEKEEVAKLPPRRELHKTDRTKMTRWFYTILIVAFSILTAGLLLWGFLALNE